MEFVNGEASHKSDPELKLSFKQLAARLVGTGGPVVGRGNVNPAGVGNAFAVHVVDVEVDPDTGKVEILRYTALQDVGKAVHPSYVEGQLQGGVAQGIGWALNEEYVYSDSGEMANSSFLDYRMPTSLDLPMIDTVIVEVANPGWLSGGLQVLPNLVLPYNRMVIIGFALFVVLLTWLLLNKTRLGLNVRAVTQNRNMAACLGVLPGRIELIAFRLGSGLARPVRVHIRRPAAPTAGVGGRVTSSVLALLWAARICTTGPVAPAHADDHRNSRRDRPS